MLTEMGRVFVGRAPELERLDELRDRAGHRTPRVALVFGEPGVGKTRLAAELAARMHAAGAVVLAGRSDEDLGVPYQPFVEALRHFVDGTSDAGLRRGLGRHAGELVRLAPEIAHRIPDLPPPLRSDPETERYRLFDAVAAWLGALSHDRSLLMVLDDLHWAAKPTLQLLRHVSRSPEAPRLLIVATYRDTELGRDHPMVDLLADLRRQPGVERLALAGLDESAVVEFMERAAGHRLDEQDRSMARFIHGETEGNPFFVREILRHLTETGRISRRDGRWSVQQLTAESSTPDGVREVVGRRLSRLSEGTHAVLRIAAAVGTEFEVAVVQAAGDADEDALLSALDEACLARLVIDVPGAALRYRFAHALVRATLNEELSAARRAAVHRRVAAAIEDLHAVDIDDQLPALAHHWARAAAGAPEAARAVEYALRAGRRALTLLANDDAVRYFRQAVGLLTVSGRAVDRARHVELLIALGEAERRAGDAAHRETLLTAADLAGSDGDTRSLALAAVANSPGSKPSAFGVTDHERVAVLESALQAVGPDDNAVRARLLAILALELFHTGDRARRLALSDEALAIARRLDDPDTLSHVLVARPFAIGGPDTLAERLADTGELLAVAERLGDSVTAHRAWWLRYRVAVEVGDPFEANRCLAAEQQFVDGAGQPTLAWMTTLQRVAAALLRGDLPAAERLIPSAREQGTDAGQPDAALYEAIQLFQLRYDQGRVGEAETVLTRVIAAAPELPALRAALAVLHSELGRVASARSLFDELAGAGFADLPVEASTMVAWCLCTVVGCTLGDPARAAQLHGLLVPYPDQIAVWAVGLGVGSVAHHLGRLAFALGDLDEADARFAAAADLERRVGGRTWLARTELEWARALLARGGRGDVDHAHHLLAGAAGTARELGLDAVRRRVAELAGPCR